MKDDANAHTKEFRFPVLPTSDTTPAPAPPVVDAVWNPLPETHDDSVSSADVYVRVENASIGKKMLGSFLGTLTWLILIGMAFGFVSYRWGTTRVTAIFEGEAIDGAPVRIDGRDAGKTPFNVRLGPGSHVIEVRPPEGYEANYENQRLYFWTIILGVSFVADFKVIGEAIETEQITPEN